VLESPKEPKVAHEECQDHRPRINFRQGDNEASPAFISRYSSGAIDPPH
jgi:hypothetical protein